MTRIGKYDIQSELARGGIGKVYRAYDASVGRPVAIKLLNAETDREMLARFSQEAAAAGNLHHRNIVTIYEFGQDGDMPFLAMEFLEGRNLQEVIRTRESLTTLQIMQIMSQAAEGLRAAHQHGIVHRDIKPGNIMLTRDGTVKLMDFGIARVRNFSGSRMTQKGDLVGTLFYMSPEQFAGAEADHLCDVFSFGVVYYELLTGHHPFEAEETAALIHKVLHDEPLPIRSLVPDAPEALERLILRAMAKDPRQRYQKIEDLQIDAAPLLIYLQSERARELVASARRSLAAAQIQEANDLVRDALELDPGNRDARLLRTSIQDKLAANRDVSHQISEARTRLSREDLTGADLPLSQVLATDPSNSEALALQESIREVRRIRDRARLLRAQIVKARGLILIREYDRALVMLTELQTEYPEAPQVSELFDEARRLREESQSANQRAMRLENAHKLIDDLQLAPARKIIEELASENPKAPEVIGLLERARQLESRLARSERHDRLVAEASQFVTSGDWDGLCAVIEEALTEFPNDDLFQQLLREGDDARLRAKLEREQKQVIEHAQTLRDSGRSAEALQVVHLGLLEIPDSAALLALREELTPEFAAERLRRAAEGECEMVRRLIQSGKSHAALALLRRAREWGVGEEEMAQLEAAAQNGSPIRTAGGQALGASVTLPSFLSEHTDDPGVLARVTKVLRGFFVF